MRTAAHVSRRGLVYMTAAALLYAAFLFLFLPRRIVVMNDDFGYLRSIVETVQQGRPWTNDWLEPWAYSVSSICATAFLASGSFITSTQGFLLFSGVATLVILSLLFRERQAGALTSVLAAILLATFPTALWKHLEFTAVALYIPCLLGALLSAERKRWGIFLLCWILAVASRQSAIVWLILPMWKAATCLRLRQWPELRSPLVVLVAAVLWFGVLFCFANQTHAQEVITSRLWAEADRQAFRNFAVGLVYVIGALGLGTLVLGVIQGHRSPALGRSPLRTVLQLMSALLMIAAAIWPTRLAVNLEHSGFDGPLSLFSLRCLLLASAAGLTFYSIRFRASYLAAATASLALVSIRRDLYDYYLIDAVILGFFASTPSFSEEKATEGIGARWMMKGVLAVFAVLMMWNQTRACRRMKEFVDHRAASCLLYERALRAGTILVTDLSEAPFGFVAWHLYPYYIEHEGKHSAGLDGFGGYLAQGHVTVAVNPDPASLQAKDIVVLDSGTFSFGWFKTARFFLISRAAFSPPPMVINWAEYHRQNFPLNDGEWRLLVQNRISK